MKKFKRGILAAAAAALIFLYLISSTDLVLKEQVDRVYTISVIANDTNEECFVNYRGGMEQAMKEWVADVNFVSLYERDNVAQQMELIMREIENGAEAILVFPVNGQALAQLLEENSVNVPIIFVNAWVESEKVTACIYTDNNKRGRQMLEAIEGDFAEEPGSVYAFMDASGNTEAMACYEGLRAAGEEKGISTILCTYQDEADLYKQVGEAFQAGNENVLLALSPQTLTLLLQKYKEGIAVRKNIYGMGYSNYILYHLDAKNLSGITIHDDYDCGYLGVKTVVSLLKRERVNRDIQVESFFLRPENVYEEVYEKILFPI